MASWNPPPGSSHLDMPPGAEPSTKADKWALVALAVGITGVVWCVPIVNCLAPFTPLIIGIVALAMAKNAANPSRARTYGWVATGIGIVIALVLIAFFVFYGAVFMAAIEEGMRYQSY
jgi:hypothetical protein